MNSGTKDILYFFYLIPLLISCGLISCENQSQVNKGNQSYVNYKKSEESMKAEMIRRPLDSVIEDYEPANRVNWQKPEKVISLMGNLKNKTVAEIGAGTGFFTFRILPHAAKTIGIDIDKRLLGYLDSIRTHYLPERLGNKLELRYVEPDDPNLEKAEADIIFLANTFVYLPNKVKYLRRLRDKLKKKGKIFIVDFKMHRIAVGPDRSEKIPQYKVEDLLIKAGYTIQLSDDTILPYQYIIIASRN